jgi:hypothetical protein
MTRITRAAWGLSEWAARLLFGAGIATGAYGVYVALFSSLGERDPGHDWLLGVEFMGLGFTASVMGHIAAFRLYDWQPGRATGDSYKDWFWMPYAMFLLTGIALLLLSCGLRLIGDWERSNVAINGTFSNCTSQTIDNELVFKCTYEWEWRGSHHTVRANADAQHDDGTPVLLHIDPVTGGLDDHDAVGIVVTLLIAGFFGLFVLAFYWTAAEEIYKRRRNFPQWLADMAWWRPLVRPVPPPPPTVPQLDIEDEAPADSVPATRVEDAQPPGY